MSKSLMAPTSAAEAVANGAQLLDEKQPGWYQNINLSTLSISQCENCICGQLAHSAYSEIPDTGPRYLKFLNKLLGTRYTVPWAWRGDRKDVTHGFGSSQEWSFSELDREWGKVIRARLEADKLEQETFQQVREAALV